MHTVKPASTVKASQKAYVTTRRLTEPELFERASELLAEKYLRGDAYCNPNVAKDFLRYKLGHLEREVFAVMLLDSQHRMIEYQQLFQGTINASPVYAREVVKSALLHNAAAVILAHNHPSGVPEPSDADKQVTKRLTSALDLVEVKVLDHIVIGETTASFAERGLL